MDPVDTIPPCSDATDETQPPRSALAVKRNHTYAMQFDSATQRVQPAVRKLNGFKAARHQVLHHIFMDFARMFVSQHSGENR